MSDHRGQLQGTYYVLNPVMREGERIILAGAGEVGSYQTHHRDEASESQRS